MAASGNRSAPPAPLEGALRGTWHLLRDRAPRRLVTALTDSAIPRATVAGLLTARPGRFTAYELSGGGRLRQHALRDGPEVFSLHHGGADASVLAEVFRARHYAMSDAVLDRLRGLGRPPRVADLGAHVGLFGLWVYRQLPGAEVVSYEPDPFNAAALRRTIDGNRRLRGRWRAVEACAAAADGERSFAAGVSSSSRIAAGGGVRVLAQDALPDLLTADLVKIDIEGGEWELLADQRFDGLRAELVFLEYHRHLSPTDDPRTAAISRLAGLGYTVEEVFCTPEATGLLRARRTAGA